MQEVGGQPGRCQGKLHSEKGHLTQVAPEDRGVGAGGATARSVWGLGVCKHIARSSNPTPRDSLLCLSIIHLLHAQESKLPAGPACTAGECGGA